MKNINIKYFYQIAIIYMLMFIGGMLSLLIGYYFSFTYFDNSCLVSLEYCHPLFTFWFAIGNMFSAGLQARCSRLIGLGKTDKSIKVYFSCFAIFLIFVIVLSLVLFINKENLLLFLGIKNTSENYEQAYKLVDAFILGGPAIVFTCMSVTALQLDYKTKLMVMSVGSVVVLTFTMLVIAVNIFNIDFTQLWIIVNSCLYVSVAILLVWFIVSKKTNFCISNFVKSTTKFSFTDLAKVAKEGVPSIIAQLSNTLTVWFLNLQISNNLSEDALIALFIINCVSPLLLSFSSGFGSATLLFISQLRCESNVKLVHNFLGFIIKSCVVVYLTITVVCCMLSTNICLIFIEESDTIYSIANYAIVCYFSSLVMTSIVVSWRNLFQGIGKNTLCIFICFLQNFLAKAIVAFVLCQFSPQDVWLVYPVSSIIVLLIVVVCHLIWARRTLRATSNNNTIKPKLNN